MTNQNTVIIRGRLTNDPQKVELENTEITNFTLANNREYYNSTTKEKKEEVFFIDCKGFGGIAKLANQYLTKGRDILVTGYLKQDKWKDKESGDNRSKLIVQIDNFEFLGGPNKGEKSEDKESPAEKPAEKTKKKIPF